MTYFKQLQDTNDDVFNCNDECQKCNSKMIRESESNMVCESCGMINELIGVNYSDGKINNLEGYNSIKSDIGGSIHTSAVNSKKIKEDLVLEKIKKIQSTAEHNGCNIFIPQYVINNACEFYFKIMELMGTNSSRAEVLLYMLGSCLSYSCRESGCIYTDKQIAKFMGLKKDGLSNGNRKIYNLTLCGKLKLNKNYNLYKMYLDKYLETLNIDNKYSNVLREIILETRLIYSSNFSDEILKKYNMVKNRYYKIGFESRIVTKCVGMIYVLCKLLKYKDKDIIKKIEIMSDIKKSTFNKFSSEVFRYSELLNLENRLLSI